MVRRRHTQKASTLRKKPRPVSRVDSKLKKWEKASDIPLDEEDQFHASRDKILLEDEGGGDEDLDDDEVFALNGLSDDDEDSEDAEPEVDEDEDEEQPPKPSKPKSSKSSKKNVDASSESSDSEKEFEEETWGTKKSAFYDADEVDSDDEEAQELEEQEAKRLQAKSRIDMTEEHFGLEDSTFAEELREDDVETPSEMQKQPLPTDKNAILRYLERTDPESLALSRDWTDTIATLSRTRERMSNPDEHPSHPLTKAMFHLYFQALHTYASLLAFYIHLRSQPKYVENPKLLKAHPIISRLLTLKQSLNMFEEEEDQLELYDEEDELDLDEDELEEIDMEDGVDIEGDDFDALMADADAIWTADKEEGADGDDTAVDNDELQELYQEAFEASSKKKDKPKAVRVPDILEDDGRPKKKRKTSFKTERPVFDLVEPEFQSSKKSPLKSQDSAGDAFGELTSLQSADAADKSARRKTLRFHTSKIESASARRQGARSAALGGDDDLPYRERKREKDARNAKEAAAKVSKQGGADLDDKEPEPSSKRGRGGDGGDEDLGGSADELEGYYDLVANSSKAKKEKKKAEYEAARAAERYVEEDGDESGPRSLTRAILANKGLTPHRSKSVRNPRVKKRQRFDKAKKKISSQKPVYKGGLGQTGRYEGEKSGISKVVKSVRLT